MPHKAVELFCRITRASSSSPDVGAASARSTQDDTWHGCQDDIPAGFHPYHVGKSRRRYRTFLPRRAPVLFRTSRSARRRRRHRGRMRGSALRAPPLMLENADPKPESLDELVDFYAC
ncbi:hypothetical protein HPP92_002390 [Vanilla planifolia]|uniref:Uncharacterized protein n=1 Tax=Vanilla planifolia TaxID=51239 RepID=A0A835RY50_VANPL|nr:hypothetical protein HPP92_002390 [Vanilla planifolia]